MSDSRPEQLILAEELVYNGKVEEALEIVMNFEKKGELTPKDQLSALLLKGNVYVYNQQMKDAVKVGELAYSMSQELGLVPESIDALSLMAQMWFLGNVDKALKLILEAEKLLNSLSDESSANISKLKYYLAYTKSCIYLSKSDINIALDLALEALTLGEKIKNNVMVGYALYQITLTYLMKGELDTALEYAMKSLKLAEELDFQVQIASTVWVIGRLYYLKGDLNRALEFCKKGLSIEKISDIIKVYTLSNLGFIYRDRGELDKALKYTKQSSKLAEGGINYMILIINKRNIGEIYRKKGEIKQAIKYFEQSLVLSEKIGSIITMIPPLLYLLLISLDTNSHEQAEQYFKRLENLFDQNKSTAVKQGYLLGKALMLKTSSRMADKAKAAGLLKQLVEPDIAYPPFYILSIVSLCALLLEELSIYNNPEIMDEINPYISRLLEIAENQRSYHWLAEVYILQAKLSLLTFEINKSQRFLIQAQQIAERYGLSQLAIRIAQENEEFQKKSAQWGKLKENDAPIAERMELARLDDQIEGMVKRSPILSTQVMVEKVTISKEKKICLVCRGEVLKFSYICKCGANYCENCARALIDLENVCWSCDLPIDSLKPTKPFEDQSKREMVDKKPKKKK